MVKVAPGRRSRTMASHTSTGRILSFSAQAMVIGHGRGSIGATCSSALLQRSSNDGAIQSYFGDFDGSLVAESISVQRRIGQHSSAHTRRFH